MGFSLSSIFLPAFLPPSFLPPSLFWKVQITVTVFSSLKLDCFYHAKMLGIFLGGSGGLNLPCNLTSTGLLALQFNTKVKLFLNQKFGH